MVLSQQYGIPKKKNTIIFPMFKWHFFLGNPVSAAPPGISGWMWRALMPKHLGERQCVFHRWFDEQPHKSQPPAGFMII
jgi:hypothetical protein